MPELAWPFLIGRTRTQDHRFVVIPAFMTAAPLASALRASTDGDPGAPDAALLREIWVEAEGPVTAVYSVRTAQAEDYNLPGDGLLTDEHGRPILLTEGLVLRRAASAVMKTGVPRAALNQAHSLVTPAYRAFWTEGDQFVRRTGQAFTLASDDPFGAQLKLESGRAAAGESAMPDAPGKDRRTWVQAVTILSIAIFLTVIILIGAILAIRLLIVK